MSRDFEKILQKNRLAGEVRRIESRIMRVAVVTRYFPSSAEPWQGRSAYQTLRILAREADVHVFFRMPPILAGFAPEPGFTKASIFPTDRPTSP